MTDSRRAALDAEIAKLIPEDKPDAKKPRGHNRGKTVLHDRPGQHPELRGVPLIGTGPGCIEGTRPGDSVRELEVAATDIRIANETLAAAKAQRMREARDELRKGKP